ncbi:MAG: methyltransferase domain-containing protein [Candidatus Latescibacteria bacterium]|nr:methyltransferase domain-containing protein [Candidatus Latescibacterota bacterium]NIM66380.1 methyltransferase domain-containing protein [Candidatus Latescibacterota bacterium]NIO02859.1 methyltransferase domain-containing protein [Candidatus Latescibacterota bacterium]NIO29994.1 methyltransferase domain-containing protein [Candidatus Latescibacterota bacterium]NIO57609.1 methyltransferase domain-containing protein [Candidatus Latescibacterota bacterium]
MPKRDVSDFFDSYASDFNAIYGNRNTLLNNLINKLFRKSMRVRYIRTIEGCEPIEGRSVIDIGCGPGHYGVALAKKGAARVCGIDFAESMIDLAKSRAVRSGVADRCSFFLGDFWDYPAEEKFDYAIVMGFMDYIEDPRELIERVLSLTSHKAFFSFPSASGFLAWQRRLRYRKRCDLFMYDLGQLYDLFEGTGYQKIHLEKINRDYFVTVSMAKEGRI